MSEKVKQLTAPEIRRLIKAHNVLTKITIPKGAKKADLVKLVEDAGFKLDHKNKKITKTRKGKQDISEGTSIDLPAPPPKLTKEEKEKKKKERAEKKAQERVKVLKDADKQAAALKKLREARKKKKQDLERKFPKAPPAPAPSKPSKPAPKVKVLGTSISEVMKGLKQGEKPAPKVVKQIQNSFEEVMKTYIDGSIKDFENNFVPFVGSRGMNEFYMLYVLSKNNSDCSVSKRIIDAFYDNIGGAKKVLKVNKDEIVKDLIRCRKRGKMLVLPIGTNTHQNNLIFNHIRNEVERFEPHGYTRQKEGTDKDNLGLTPALKEINKALKAAGEDYEYKYMKPKQVSRSQITKRGNWVEYEGLQYHDRSGGNTREFNGVVITEAGGYCLAWSYFYLDLRLKFPKLSGEEIIDKTYELVDNKSGQQKLRNMVAGMTKMAYEEAKKMVPKYISETDLIKGMDSGKYYAEKEKFAEAVFKYFTDTGIYSKMAA